MENNFLDGRLIEVTALGDLSSRWPLIPDFDYWALVFTPRHHSSNYRIIDPPDFLLYISIISAKNYIFTQSFTSKKTPKVLHFEI